MIPLFFSYFPEGEDVDYKSDEEGDDDEDEILWVCCDGCNLWYHSPCLEEVSNKYSIKWQKEIMVLVPFLTGFCDYCFYTNTHILGNKNIF